MNSRPKQNAVAINSNLLLDPNLEASRSENLNNEDELISSLQNRRENCRARQVFEWENVRRQKAPQLYLRGAA